MVKVRLRAVVKVRVGHNCTQPEGSTQGKKVPVHVNRKEFPAASIFQDELTWELTSELNLRVNIWCEKTLSKRI